LQPLTTAPSRARQVYEAIRESICDCTLEPGRHLVQEELAAMLGVSRQPVQQAMLLLKNDGLVVELGARGLHVAPLDPGSMIHHYQIRVVLDQLAARLVAERAAASPQFAARLRREGEAILAEGDRHRATDGAAREVAEDVRFHSSLYAMSGNPLIAQTAEPHWMSLRRVMIAVALHAGRGEIVWTQHRAIFDALAGGDADAGVRAATSHVLGAQEALLAAMGAGAVPGGGASMAGAASR
jgi:DNA-binding GntR family transcriptional regulator